MKLSDELDMRLRHEAKRRSMTISELTREAIDTHLGHSKEKRLLLAASVGHSGHKNISEQIEEILRAEVAK